MSKQKSKQYLVAFTYENRDTGEEETRQYSIHASSKSEAVIKAVDIFNDMFIVSKVTCMGGK